MAKDEWETKFQEWKTKNKQKLELSYVTEYPEEPKKSVEKKTVKVEEKKESKVEKKVDNKKVIWGSVILVLIAVIIVAVVATPPVESKFKDVDVDVRNTTGVPTNVYYKNVNVFSVSGWESKLKYDGKEDRVFGRESYRQIVFDEKGKGYTVTSTSNGVVLEPLTTDPNEVTRIGWFSKLENIQITEDESWSEKEVKVSMDGEGAVESVEFDYQFYRKKPYFTIGFDAGAKNVADLESMSYGLILKGYDIYLDNGTILENDNKVITLEEGKDIVLRQNGINTDNISGTLMENVAATVDVNAKKTERRGSTHTIDDARQQVFYNPEEKRAVIVYADEVTEFVNSFYWNVYWVKVPYSNGFPELNVVVFEDATLTYEGNEWKVESSEFDGYVNDYIFDMLGEIEEE